LTLLLLAFIVSTGCSSASKQPPPPLQPPVVTSSVSYRPGGPIGLPTTRPVESITAGEALGVRTTWLALSSLPESLQPILSQATLITAPQSADPFLAAGQLSRGAQIVAGDQIDAFLSDVEQGKYGQRATIATSDAALPRDVTTTFALSDDARRVELGLHRLAPTTTPTTAPSDVIELSLGLESGDAQPERLLLDPKPMPPPARFAVVIPSQFWSPPVKAIVAIVELTQPTDTPEHVKAVAACVEQLRGAPGAGTSAALPTPAPAWGGLTTALRAMERPEGARVAMVYLAGETQATVLGDVALVAPDPVLAELSAHIRQRAGSNAGSATQPSQLGWMLDVATLEQLAAMQSAEKLPVELAGVLARVAGEAARNAGSLEELTKVNGREQFEARLIAENFTYLEDASPSARVRAYDWLKTRGRAPANYDPLGSAKERAAAIDEALTEATPAAQTLKPTGGVP
jgi:hypothetical protein